MAKIFDRLKTSRLISIFVYQFTQKQDQGDPPYQIYLEIV